MLLLSYSKNLQGGLKLGVASRNARKRWVVPKVQALVRGYFLRKHLAAQRYLERCAVAAIVAQRLFRGFRGRKGRAKGEEYATKKREMLKQLFARRGVFRGLKARKRVMEIRRQRAYAALLARA